MYMPGHGLDPVEEFVVLLVRRIVNEYAELLIL
jgi:hypothetical protein